MIPHMFLIQLLIVDCFKRLILYNLFTFFFFKECVASKTCLYSQNTINLASEKIEIVLLSVK